ncbi:MAG: potassium transporter TrkA [Proteobacteria bacterium]|nr:potassium transporter TrkA [Pseudomonadota bacterium]
MKQRPTLLQKIQYRFDNTLSSGSSAIIAWLAIISTMLVIVFGAIYVISGLSMPDSEGMGFFEAAWQALMRSVDPGTIAGDEGWSFRLFGLLITISGIFILSTLIGVLTAGLEEKLEDLRKGRSLVLESGHTLIMGWSDKIFHIIEQLILANENLPNARIVVLAPNDKAEMEDELRARINDFKTTRIVCRTGSPLILEDIELVSPHDARSIIVLAPENEDPDTYVIKSVLALTNNPNRKAEPYHIVAELDDDANMEAANLVGQDEACYVRTSNVLAKIAAQTCRQSGLSMIYADLLDYSGDEIYLTEEPQLVGKSYQESLAAYASSAVIGIYQKAGKKVLINPPMHTLFEQGDSVITISEDDDTVVLSTQAPTEANQALVVSQEQEPAGPEKNVLLGWNAKGPRIIKELDNYVASGSELTVIAEGADIQALINGLDGQMTNQRVSLINDDITQRSVLESLDYHGRHNVIILNYYGLPMQEADAKTLITLLHLRNIAEQQDVRFNIISEMRDIKNRKLAEVARADDFIIGDNLISLYLSQVSETKELEGVFNTLFSAEGAEIYLNPAINYVQPDADMDFYTLLESAVKQGETAIGYRVMAEARNAEKNYGVRLKPNKNERFSLAGEDRVIVLADE